MAVLGDGGVLKINDAFVCDVEAWEFQVGASSIDITPLGKSYAEAIKDLITGGGTLNFFMEWRKDTEGNPVIDPTELMDFVQLTKAGAEVSLELFLITRDGDACQQSGQVYYSMQALLTNVSLSTRATDVIRGAAQFVTTGPFQLVKDTA